MGKYIQKIQMLEGRDLAKKTEYYQNLYGIRHFKDEKKVIVYLKYLWSLQGAI